MLLATHPEIQERVASEIKEVFYSNEVEFTYDNLSKLEYLERVIKESLRLCPVVPSEAKLFFTLIKTKLTFYYARLSFYVWANAR
jgi:cytochrome P450